MDGVNEDPFYKVLLFWHTSSFTLFLGQLNCNSETLELIDSRLLTILGQLHLMATDLLFNDCCHKKAKQLTISFSSQHVERRRCDFPKYELEFGGAGKPSAVCIVIFGSDLPFSFAGRRTQ